MVKTSSAEFLHNKTLRVTFIWHRVTVLIRRYSSNPINCILPTHHTTYWQLLLNTALHASVIHKQSKMHYGRTQLISKTTPYHDFSSAQGPRCPQVSWNQFDPLLRSEDMHLNAHKINHKVFEVMRILSIKMMKLSSCKQRFLLIYIVWKSYKTALLMVWHLCSIQLEKKVESDTEPYRGFVQR